MGGLEEEQDYEYHAVEGECHFDKKLTKATVESSFNITEGDEDQLTLSIAYFNPVSIAFEVAYTLRNIHYVLRKVGCVFPMVVFPMVVDITYRPLRNTYNS